MSAVAIIAGILILLIVLWDTFETIVLSKTVRRRFSLSGFFYNGSWQVWRFLIKRFRGGLRQAVLVSYGPLSLLSLIAVWAVMLVSGFALIHWGDGSLNGAVDHSLGENFYFSGVTFFTLGFGDLTPTSASGRFLSVAEAGLGFGFLAVVIGYVPVMYAAFSRRETLITLLDSKAGSEPTAGELLRRHAEAGTMEALVVLLKEWEVWSAQQLEAYLSYPILAYYRSQHDDQSWLCSLTAILDTCSLVSIGFEQDHGWERALTFQAKATFAMARHVIVDLAYIIGIPPVENPLNRCSPRDWQMLHEEMRALGIPLNAATEDKLAERRAMYEPYVVSLARDLYFTLPSWIPTEGAVDNWQTSAWESPKHF